MVYGIMVSCFVDSFNGNVFLGTVVIRCLFVYFTKYQGVFLDMNDKSMAIFAQWSIV